MVKTKIQRERDAVYLYKRILKTIIYPLLGRKVTYLSDLDSIGHQFLKHKFKGVFPSDQIPKLTELQPYCILNLDKSTETGSHWVAIAKIPGKQKKVLFYDSFGRKGSKIIPKLELSGNGRVINTDDDAEQGVMETDCGCRCLAFLLLCEHWGLEKAKLI